MPTITFTGDFVAVGTGVTVIAAPDTLSAACVIAVWTIWNFSSNATFVLIYTYTRTTYTKPNFRFTPSENNNNSSSSSSSNSNSNNNNNNKGLFSG